MPGLVRTLLLVVLAVCLALPLAGGAGARGGAEAATRPCPSRPVLKACALETAPGIPAPRGTASPDAPCQGKAIGVEASAPAAPSACGPLAYEVASALWSAWAPPTPAPPPRS